VPNYSLAVDPGSFALTGTTVNLRLWRLTAAVAAFVLSGPTVGLFYSNSGQVGLASGRNRGIANHRGGIGSD